MSIIQRQAGQEYGTSSYSVAFIDTCRPLPNCNPIAGPRKAMHFVAHPTARDAVEQINWTPIVAIGSTFDCFSRVEISCSSRSTGDFGQTYFPRFRNYQREIKSSLWNLKHNLTRVMLADSVLDIRRAKQTFGPAIVPFIKHNGYLFGIRLMHDIETNPGPQRNGSIIQDDYCWDDCVFDSNIRSAFASLQIPVDEDWFYTSTELFWRNVYRRRVLPAIADRSFIMQIKELSYPSPYFTIEIKNYLGYVHGRHTVIGLLHDIETNPGPAQFYVPDTELGKPFVGYAGSQLMREKFLTSLSSILRVEDFNNFMEVYSTTTTTLETTKCKCLVCEMRQNDSPWKDYYLPREVSVVVQAVVVFKHITHILTTHTTLTTRTINTVVASLINHGMSYTSFSKSIEKDEVVACMDVFKAFTGSSIKDITSSTNDAVASINKMNESGIQMPDIEKLSESIDNAVEEGIKTPDIANLAEAIKGGIKIEASVTTPLLTKLGGMCKPLLDLITGVKDGIRDGVKETGALTQTATGVFIIGSVEYLRSTVKPGSMYDYGLCLLNLYLASKTNDMIFSFAIGYYGVTIGTNLFKLISDFVKKDSDSDSDGEEEVFAFSEFNNVEAKKTFIEMMMSALTGLTDVITIKNAVVTFGLYKTLVTSATFCLDSLFDITLRLCNWLGGEKGCTFFRTCYNRYPVLHTIQDDLNAIADKITRDQPFKSTDVAKFLAILDGIRGAQRMIPIGNGNQVYLGMVSELEKKWHKLHVTLKSSGILCESLVVTAFVVGIIGPPHIAKTQIINETLEILIQNNYSAEFYEEFKRNRNRYWYIWKRQKFADSYTSQTMVVILDDLGAVSKAASPETCEFLWWIAKVNPVPDKVDKSSVGDKDTIYFKPDFIGWTSNDSFLDPDKMWATRPEAVYRRMTNGSLTTWYVEVLDEYKIPDVTSNWGYRVDKERLKFDKFNIDTFRMVEYNMELGKNLNEPSSGNPIGKSYTWIEYIKVMDERFKAHRAREQALIKNNNGIALDPAYNPFIKPLEAKMDTIRGGLDKLSTLGFPKTDPAKTLYGDELKTYLVKSGLKIDRLPDTFNDLADPVYDDLTPEQNHLLILHLKSCKTSVAVTELRPLKTYKRFDDFVDDIWAVSSQRLRAHKTLDQHDFINWHSSLVYGCLGNESWANFAESHRKGMLPYYEAMVKDCRGLITGEFVYRADNALNIWNCERSFKGYTYMMIDLSYKCTQLGKLWELGMLDVYRTLRKNGVSVQSVVRDCTKILCKTCVSTWMLIDDASHIVWGANFHFKNMWVDLFLGGLVALLATTKVATTVAVSEYNRKIKVVTNPLKKKCKETKLKVDRCGCNGCKKIVKDYYDKINGTVAKSDLVIANSALVGNRLKNVKEVAKSTLERNCWNLHFIMSEVSKAPLVYNNAITPCTQIAMYPHHFHKQCVDLVQANPGPAIMRFINSKGTRYFDVNFRDICRSGKEFPTIDRYVWINQGYCSFGGGIRNIIDLFMCEDEPAPKVGFQYLMRYNQETGSIDTEAKHNVHIGKENIDYVSLCLNGKRRYYTVRAYVVDIATVNGHCGSPLFTADDRLSQQKIMGMIVAGSTEKPLTYVVAISRNFLEDIIKEFDVMTFDTSDLPFDVEDTKLVNQAFSACAVIPDTHPMPTHNTIKRTELHGLFGEPDKIPCFISVVEDEVKGEYCVQNLVRDKYTANGPACSHTLMSFAVQMMVSDIEDAIPPTEERHYVLTVMEAINGAKGEAPLSVKTSAGAKYLLQDITKKMIVKRNADELDLSSAEGQQFLRDIDYKLECYENKKIPLNFANEFPKVECLPTEKALDGKCRLVCGTDADNCIAVKCHYAWYNRLLKKVGFASGLLIGQNPNGYNSHVMTCVLMLWNVIRDTDVSKWDSSFFRYMILMNRDIAIRVSRCTDPKALNAMNTIAESMMYIIHVAHVRYHAGEFVSFAVFYEWLHGMISGDYLTLLFNTGGNGGLFRYIFLCVYVLVHFGVDPLDYDPSVHGFIDLENLRKEFVHFCTGDDSLTSLAPSASWFTTELSVQMYARHGVKCTPSDKDGVFRDKSLTTYSTLPSDFTFCQRYVIWCPEYNRWVWALSRSSMNCSIYYTENFKEKEQVINDYFKSLAFHGKKVFLEDGPVLDEATYRLYGFRSPFNTYEIALAAAVGEIDQDCAMRIKAALDSGLIPPEFMQELKNKARLAEFLGSRAPSKISTPTGEEPLSASEEYNNFEELVECDHLEKASLMPAQELVNEEKYPVVALMETDGTTKFDDYSTAVEDIGLTRPTDVYSDRYSEISEFFKRPALLTRITANTSQVANTDIYEFDIGPKLNGVGAVKLWEEKTNGYAGCTGTAVVTVTINATNMQKGAWLLHYIPCYSHNATASSMNVNLMQKSQHPGIMFTCDKNEGDSIVLKIPYVTPSAYYKFSNGLYDWGKVFITVFSPLKNSATALSADFDMTVFLHFEDFKLVIPTVQALSESTNVATLPLSTALAKTSKIVSRLGDIPTLSSYAKPASWVLGAAAKTAAAFGYSKPSITPHLTYTVPKTAKYAATADGADTSDSVTLSSMNQVSSITYMTPRKEDEMSFNYLKSIWSYFGTYNVTISTVVGTTVATIPISPGNFFNAATTPTVGGHAISGRVWAPFAHISKHFGSWRGSIEIKIRAISTVETGRFKVMFFPYPDSTGGVSLDMTAMTVIMDLSASKEITLKVPFMSQYHFIGPTDVSGTVIITVLNQLRAPETVANNVDFLMFVRAGEDYEVGGPTADSTPVVAFSDTSIVFGDQPIRPLTTSYTAESIGEMFNGVKQLLMRSTFMVNNVATTYWGGNCNFDFLEAVAMDGAGALIGPSYGGTIHPSIIAMYAFRRGGHVGGLRNMANAQLGYKGTNNLTMYAANNQPGRLRDWKAVISNQPVLEANVSGAYSVGVGVRVPYLCDTPFTINRLTKSDVAYTDGDEAWGSVSWSGTSATVQSPWRYYADDFQCGFFVCTPVMFVSYL